MIVAIGSAGGAYARQVGGETGGSWFWLVLLLGVAAISGFAINRLRGLSLTPAGRRARPDPTLEPDRAVLLLAGSFLVFLIASVGVGLAGAALLPDPDAPQTLREQGLLGLIYYATGITAAILGFKAIGARLTGFRAADVPVGLLAVVLAAPFLVLVGQISTLVFELLGRGTTEVLQHGTLDALTDPASRGSPWFWAVLAGAVLGAPIFEEILFRGMLQPAIAGLTRRRWAGVLVSSAVFTALHVPTGEASTGATLAAIPTIAALAFALAVALERTRSLGVPIVMHIAFNAANVAVAFAVT